MKIKNVITSFEGMHYTAYRTLTACLNLILISLCLFCLYLSQANKSILFSLWIQKSYITDTALSAVLLSFGGAFLLDIAHKSEGK